MSAGGDVSTMETDDEIERLQCEIWQKQEQLEAKKVIFFCLLICNHQYWTFYINWLINVPHFIRFLLILGSKCWETKKGFTWPVCCNVMQGWQIQQSTIWSSFPVDKGIIPWEFHTGSNGYNLLPHSAGFHHLYSSYSMSFVFVFK